VGIGVGSVAMVAGSSAIASTEVVASWSWAMSTPTRPTKAAALPAATQRRVRT
jgi:hypothetical protein